MVAQLALLEAAQSQVESSAVTVTLLVAPAAAAESVLADNT